MAVETATRHRVAIFLPSLEGGGAEGVMTDLANFFAERGVDVAMLTARRSGPNLARVGGAIKVVELGGRGVLTAILPLARWLRAHRPQALLSAMTHANVAASAAVRLTGRPKPRLVLSERMSLAARRGFYVDARERLLVRLMPSALRTADAIVVPASGMVDDLARHARIAPERFTVIGNPVVGPDFGERARGEWALGRKLKAQGARIVLATGRLTAVKDYPTLIRAMSRLRDCDRLHLVILGEGEERAYLETIVEKCGLVGRVHLPGYEPNPLRAMAQADVFVLSSLYEGLPNVLIQALACGARVVSTDCETGPSEILEGGRWGALVRPGDAADLAKAIERALTQRDWPDGRGRAANFSTADVADAYLRVLFPQAYGGN